MDLNEFLQGLRVVAHILTVVIVATYRPDHDSAVRIGVSWYAVFIAGMSACLAVSTVLNWAQWLKLPLAGTMCLSFMFCMLLAPLVAGRGNVATLFPRKVWSHRP